MKKERFLGTYAYRTDIGKVRTNNEDQAIVLLNEIGEVLLIVCDGMGGANKGDLASKTAMNFLSKAFMEKKKSLFKKQDAWWASKVIKEANSRIFSLGDNNSLSKGMGTTLSMALLRDNHLMVANIGDSRAYLDDGTSLKQITVDQTYVQYLVSTGKITEEEALSHPDRHVLMNALGIYPSVSLSFSFFDYHGESILLCSDGIYNQIPPDTIHAIISTNERADQKVMNLIAQANSVGGSDNEGVAYWETIKE